MMPEKCRTRDLGFANYGMKNRDEVLRKDFVPVLSGVVSGVSEMGLHRR
jgi:hypothetical protein